MTSLAGLSGGCMHPTANVGLPVAEHTLGVAASVSAQMDDAAYTRRSSSSAFSPPSSSEDFGHVDTSRKVGGKLWSDTPFPTSFSTGLRFGVVPGIDMGVEASLAHVGVNTRIDLLHGASAFHLVLIGNWRTTLHTNWDVTGRALLYVPLWTATSDDPLSLALVLGPDFSTGRFRYDTLHDEGNFLSFTPDSDPVERDEVRSGGILGLSLFRTARVETVFFGLLYTTPKYENVDNAAERNDFDKHTGLLFALSVTASTKQPRALAD